MCISLKIPLKFVPKGPINNIPALVQIMAWRRPGDKPLSEPMLVFVPTHICVTRPQWVKYGICYISATNCPIATKRKANIPNEHKASNVSIGFDFGHDLDHEFSRSNMLFAISQPKVARLSGNEKQIYQLNSRPQMWPMGLTMTMTWTFASSRSIVTLPFDHTHGLDNGELYRKMGGLIDIEQRGW